ncbi:MAG: PAS domain-containing protein [Acidimicrobiales bacterium]
MDDQSTTPAAGTQPSDVRDMYAALVQGELSGTDALAASQEMLQILMDSMANAVFWKDLDSCYLGCNKVFARFAGVDPELLIGKSDRDMPWADSDDFGSDWFIDWDNEVMSTGEPRFGIIEQLQGADGEYRWLETNKVPLRDLDGDVIGVLGTFEDVTERRHAEVELQRTLDELDERVQQRTEELMRANESLRREVEDRVRLQAEERQQRSYAEALRDTAAAMSTTFDLDEVSEEVLVGVQRLMSSDLTAIVLVESDGSHQLSKHRVGFNYELPSAADSMDPHKLSVIEEMVTQSGPVIVDEPERSLGDARSTLGARIRVGDQLLGYLFVESATTGFFNESHTDRLGAVADQAGAAISNSRLAGKASELATTEERQRVARELHDAVNQTLWTAALTSESLLNDIEADSPLNDRVQRLRVLTRGALSEMRSLLLELRPADLMHVPLEELIENLLTALDCRRTLDVTVSLEPVELDEAAHLTFYRIAQQAIGNVAQHAGATALTVRLSSGSATELWIADDGAGFDRDEVPAGHLGLQIMEERAEMVGAELEVDSEIGEGTSIRLWRTNP